MIIPFDEEIVVRVLGRTIGVPMPQIDKTRIAVDVPRPQDEPVLLLIQGNDPLLKGAVCNLYG